MISISKNEWKFVAIVGVILVIVTFGPIIFGYFNAPPGKVFFPRSTLNYTDMPIYYSQIEQARAGEIFFKRLYPSEQQSAGVLSPFWLLVGWFAKLLSLSSAVAVQVARLLVIPLLLVVLYYLAAFFFAEPVKRKICFLFFIFASGFGWFASLFVTGPEAFFLDVNVPEAFTFPTILSIPHFIVSLALLLLIFLMSLLAFESYKLKYSLWAGFCAFLLFSFHPYYVPVIFGVLGLFVLADIALNRRINWNYILHLAITLLFSLPPILYYAWTTFTIPAVHEHYLQNILLTPPLWVVIISYGFLLPLALLGAFSIFKKPQKTNADIFLLVWFFAQFSFLYLPIKTPRKLSEGLLMPMVILTMYAALYLKKKLWESTLLQPIISKASTFSRVGKENGPMEWPAKFFITLFLVLAFGMANIFVAATDWMFYAMQYPYFYISSEKYQAMLWLKELPRGSIILSETENGNMIPALTLRQVFIGHGHETARFVEKKGASSEFLKGGTPISRQQFLKKYGITHFFFAPEEKALADFDPTNEPYFKKVYENGLVTIYEVI